MRRQRENDVRNSINFAYHCCKYGGKIKNSVSSFDFVFTNFFLLFVSQPSDTTKIVTNCINYRKKLKQSNFEKNAKQFWVLNAFYHKCTGLEITFRKFPIMVTGSHADFLPIK